MSGNAGSFHIHGYIKAFLEELSQVGDDYVMRVRWDGGSGWIRVPSLFEPSIRAAMLLGPHLPLEISLLNVVQRGVELFLEPERQSYFVLEPNWLINVTTLTQLDYCKRTYLNQRFSIRKPNRFLVKGSVIHAVFEDILKNHTDHEALRQKMADVLNEYALEFAFLDMDMDAFEKEIREHLNRLYLYRKQKIHKIKQIFTERYLLENKIGLKGKIDAVLEYENGSLQALELKTGKGWGTFAKRGHAFQAQAYSLMLQMKFPERPILAPLIIYSGEDKKAEFLTRRVAISYPDTVNLMNMRNELIAADLTGRFDFKNDEKRCVKCSDQLACVSLLGLIQGTDGASELFNAYVQAMLEEYSLIKRNQGRYFTLSAAHRIKQGHCLKVIDVQRGEGLKELRVLCENDSELREGDRCLLSDEAGPLGANCVECVLLHVAHDRIDLMLDMPAHELWFKPAYLDIHSSETLFEVNFAGFAELFRSAHLTSLRDLLITKDVGPAKRQRAPNMATSHGIEHALVMDDVSDSQRRAIHVALEGDGPFLLQGPPGTGKTHTIARMLSVLKQAGKRVMVACFTHRAVEEVCIKIMAAFPQLEFYALGAVSKNERIPCLEQVVSSHNSLSERILALREVVRRNPVYVATTQAWLSGRYDFLAAEDLFDVAIVDEAAQLLLPQTVGAIRLAKRFILVGDHKQLPPVLQSPKASLLKETLFEHMMKITTDDVDRLLLMEQFRMPQPIAELISKEFYEGKLVSSLVHHHLESKGDKTKSLSGFTPFYIDGYGGDACAAPLLLIDVPSPSCCSDQMVKQNLREVGTIVNLFITLGLGAYLEGDCLKPPLGVIAPFRAQVAAIRKALQQHLPDYFSHPMMLRAIVDTVDRFQGDERDLMVLSLCVPNGDMPPDLYADPRRLNVAVSRAKKQLIIVGDWRLAERIPVLDRFKRNALKQKGCLYVDRESEMALLLDRA